MQKITSICVLAMACLLAKAQPSTLKPLSIGDTVPNIAINNIINYKTTSAKLSDFKGKLLILDFWATWCSSCLKNFPKMEDLQQEFENKIQVLAVAYEGQKKVVDFFNSKAGKKYHVASVVNDTVLGKLFPHTGIPHCVWIGSDGIVTTITGAEEVTVNNVQKILLQKEINVHVKRDINLEKPLFLSDTLLVGDTLLHYSILTKGWYSGVPTGNQLRKNGNTIIGQASTNSHLLMMYTSAAIHLFQKLGESYCDKRSIIKVKDMLKIATDYSAPDSVNKINEYNYDLIVPLNEACNLYEYMLQDLNRYTCYTGKIEKRLTKCLVLVRTDTIDRIRTKGGLASNTLFYKYPFAMTNYPIKNLITRMNDEDSISLPVIDETKYKGNIDIQLSSSRNIQIIRNELKHYGLDLKEAERPLYMFILTDKMQGNQIN